ncbi:hypothetical protein MP228_009007 [Amoeboaphelidium protococcarum]|nr:hypothetical protein MP228_009007 [Amoeboaphelidium protococcarum]
MALHIPFFGRLSVSDYQRLFFTWTFLVVNSIIELILSVIPVQLGSNLLSKWYQRLYKHLFGEVKDKDFDSFKTSKQQHPIALAQSVPELCNYFGYRCDEFTTRTSDGFYLVAHRIFKGDRRSISGSPVLLQHGFMMNSEVWVCHPEHNLALALVEAGYDVWLGNVRGNKYSCKHFRLNTTDIKYWDFSLDEHALIDLPATVDLVLSVTGRSSLSYIGFSQGTTICFAALSSLPQFRSKINLFIALAPSMTPHGLTNKFVQSAARSSPELIYLLFGRRSLLSSALMYSQLCPPAMLRFLVDTACNILFAWNFISMSNATKEVVYTKIYSLCSVKLMVHWFQLIGNSKFQMYDDLGASNMYKQNTDSGKDGKTGNPANGYNLNGVLVPQYPTKQIQDVPIAVFYGGIDSLLNMRGLLDGLNAGNIHAPVYRDNTAKNVKVNGNALNTVDEQSHVIFDSSTGKKLLDKDSPLVYLKCIHHYEHLCFLWADDLAQNVSPDVMKLLKKYNQTSDNVETLPGN